jgi:hypothetical protein
MEPTTQTPAERLADLTPVQLVATARLYSPAIEHEETRALIEALAGRLDEAMDLLQLCQLAMTLATGR